MQQNILYRASDANLELHGLQFYESHTTYAQVRRWS